MRLIAGAGRRLWKALGW